MVFILYRSAFQVKPAVTAIAAYPNWLVVISINSTTPRTHGAIILRWWLTIWNSQFLEHLFHTYLFLPSHQLLSHCRLQLFGFGFLLLLSLSFQSPLLLLFLSRLSCLFLHFLALLSFLPLLLHLQLPIAFLIASASSFSASCAINPSRTSSSVMQTVLLLSAGFLFCFGFDFRGSGRTSN